MQTSVVEHVIPDLDRSGVLVTGFVQDRLDEFTSLVEALLSVLRGEHRDWVRNSADLLRMEEPASIVRRFTSPLFLDWLGRFGGVQRWAVEDPVLSRQLARWNNMAVSPAFWPLLDEVPMAVVGHHVITADPRIALPVSPRSSSVRLRTRGDGLAMIDDDGGVVSERGWDDLVRGEAGCCLLPGELVVGRNDLAPLQLKVRTDSPPERYGSVLVGPDPSTEAYPDFSHDELLQGAAMIADVWPEEYAELELMVQVVVPRGIPQGWEPPRHSFTVASYQGAVWLALDSDPAIVAEGLVHEKGHIKLRYLAGRWPLLDPERSTELHRVGWRTDPRPLVGVLEGVFVHSQIAELMERVVAGEHGTASQLEARARYLDQVRAEVGEGLEILSGHAALTEVGHELIRSIEARTGN